jgi:hypothetical protein
MQFAYVQGRIRKSGVYELPAEQKKAERDARLLGGRVIKFQAKDKSEAKTKFHSNEV